MTKVKLKQLIQVVAGSQSVGISRVECWVGDMFIGYAAILRYPAAATVVAARNGGCQQ